MVRKEFVVLFFLLLFLGCTEDGLLNLAINNPKIDQLTPEEGVPGDTILIEGSNLADVDSVWVNGILTPINDQTPESFTIQIFPEMTTGPVIVRNPFGIALGPDLLISKLPIVIDSISPLSGIVADPVQIYGKEFDQLMTDFEVQFNGIAASAILQSDTLITTTVPEGATTGMIFLKNDADTIYGPEFIIEELPDFTIESIEPDSGEIFTEVTIIGSNFGTNLSDIEVTLSETMSSVSSINDTLIVFEVPSGATSGAVAVRKVSVDQQVIGPDFTVLAPMTIESISPTAGETDTQVTITGTNFGTELSDIEVTVDGTPAQISSVTETQVVFEVPSGATPGPVAVRKSSTDQQVIGPDFTVLDPMTIVSIDPTSGEVSTQVTITGTNFGNDANNIAVEVNSTSAQISSVIDTEIVFEVLPGTSSGPVAVEKISTGQQVTGPDFTVLDPMTILSIDPTSGEVSTQVTIAGTNFGTDLNDIAVAVNGTSAQISSVIDTEIVFEVLPGTSSGPVVVEKISTGQLVTGPDFTVLDQMTIISINPNSGPVLTEVTITGSGFDNNANDILVTVNGSSSAIISVADSEIVFEIPSGATSGPVVVQKVSTSQQATGPDFTVTTGPSVTVSTVINNGVGNPLSVLQLGNFTVNSSDQDHQIFLFDLVNNSINSIGTGTPGLVNGTNPQFNFPSGIALDASNILYVADRQNHVIRVISGGNTQTIAGLGQAGFADGSLQTQAQFNEPIGIAVIGNFIYVADFENHAIRRIDVQNNQVNTIAGNGVAGFVDGTAQTSQLSNPIGLAEDVDGNLLIADFGNHSIRKLDLTTFQLTTIAGTGSSGLVNGDNNSAQFNGPADVSVDSQGTIYVADEINHVIRKIESGTVSTMAGTGSAGYADGADDEAQFNFPTGIFVVSDTEILVADYLNGAIRRITIQ